MAKWDLSKLEKKKEPSKTFLIAAGVTPLLFFVAGLVIGYQSHPYESCSREHVGGDNIGECVWLKLNMRKE